MERELQEKLDCLLASPYGRTMLGEYAYLNATELVIQHCEAAGAGTPLPDWLADFLALGQESAEIFASLTDAGTLETDRKTMSLLLARHGSRLAKISARLRQALELHPPGPSLAQEPIEDGPSGEMPAPSAKTIINRRHWEPKAEFLPPSEMRVIGDVGGTPLVLVGYEKNTSRSPIVARSTSGDPQQNDLIAIPLSDLLAHSSEPVNVPELELAER